MDERAHRVAQDEPVGVGGWLLLFCCILTVLSPLMTIFHMVGSYTALHDLFTKFPALQVVIVIDHILSIGITFFSVYAGIRLWRRKENAINIAKEFLISSLVCTVITRALPFMVGVPREANNLLITRAAKDILRAIIFSALGYAYLKNSQRVKNTFLVR